MNVFWSMSGTFTYRHHVEPRVKLYSPREESFPFPLKYIDVSRTTRTIFRINFLVGKHFTKGGSECPLTDQQYRLEQWSNITLFLRKTSRDCISSAQKVLPGIFLGYASYAEGNWKGDIWSRTLKNWDEVDASELHARRLNAKDVLTPQRSGDFVFPVADGTVKIIGREQRLRTATLTRDRPERGLLHQNSFIVITLNPESNCTCREKNHFLFR